MKKLLNTLYVTSSDAYLSLDGENVVVKKDEGSFFRMPLHNLEGIVTFGFQGASPALMGVCAERNISLCFMSGHGRFIARVSGIERGNVLLRKEQYRISDSEERSLAMSKSVITGKLYNSRWMIERAIRDYPIRLDVDKLKKVSSGIKTAIESLQNSGDADILRGYEGEAATLYFSVFNDLILQQKEDFVFNHRNRRPPLDHVNALLSFIYAILTKEMASALETAGLDPYVGFLNRDRPGRASLALDLIEELRSVLADRFVLSLINKKIVKAAGFQKQENGAVFMDDSTRKTVLTAWQSRKQETLTHPFLDEKIEWGLVPYVQALLLARFIRGDLDAYPPFLWK